MSSKSTETTAALQSTMEISEPHHFEPQFLDRISRKGLPCIEKNDPHVKRNDLGDLVGRWISVKDAYGRKRERKLFPERFRIIDE